MVQTRCGGNGKRSRHRRRPDLVGFSLVHARSCEGHSAAISHPRPRPHKRALRLFVAPFMRAYGVQPFGQSTPAAAGYAPRSLYPSSAARAADGISACSIRRRVHARVESRKKPAFPFISPCSPALAGPHLPFISPSNPAQAGSAAHHFKLPSSSPANASVRQLLFEYI